uniref:SMODS-associated and fused to various effectors domain-containing protein n=1 Tax=Candidatus Kentrum eta TaxID=2126337 RepID=A0A450V2E3_9GAMM|nr:MAG: hypothetical protein BECKH772B_GA0070898_101443 [Candidatus Kentron sp. H]VFJ98953.1 MAG: hypothetical protein BECKH772A_GA0070896_101502 [Candidatus Kentron sp. H]VFK04070.1 MAG: hypothetical protein BECKH772C_GA0070978_101601 [Candidatus Kentron sp. H]
MEGIEEIWRKIPDQTKEVGADGIREFFEKLESDSKEKGRGKDFSVDTTRRVIQDGHGRCMFSGCGERLDIDELTGTEGNYSYPAHNVASSEKGPRGVLFLSDELSDEPGNILLLCDKHHRLIDRIAAPNYPALRLSEMRREFCDEANSLLDGLRYRPIPVFSVLWPVGGHRISAPSSLQIAQSLSAIQARMEGAICHVSDNEATLRDSDKQAIDAIMPSSVNLVAEKILMQAHGSRYKAGLFAFGLMPYLIALGARLGNKSEITPMLRSRESGQWRWASESPRGDFFRIIGREHLGNSESEIVLLFTFTARPDGLTTTANKISSEGNFRQIEITPIEGLMGNAALGHPKDGTLLLSEITKLFYALYDKHGVRKIHVLPCASNAACVFFGKGFDKFHPDLVVYDFDDGSRNMSPRVLVTNEDGGCKVMPFQKSQ